MARPDDDATLREPLGIALDEEIYRVDVLVAKLWQRLAALGFVGAVAVALTVSHPLGTWTAGFSLVALLWFTLTVSLLNRKTGGRALWITTTVFESLVPWVSFVLLVHAQGAEYALGSWVPPMLFCALVMTGIARLRPLTPLVVGLSSSLSFLALHFFVAKPALPLGAATEALFRDGTQLTRAVTLTLSGALGMYVSAGLRNVFARAESSARAQDLFGKYRLLRQIAAGGMGTVHEAVYCPEGGFERRVAVKRVHPHMASQEKLVNEFRTEAELSARLVHPNIVQVFDFGRVGDSYFLAMEYVDGMTLRTLMRRLRQADRLVPVSLVAHLGREMLAALSYSHEAARGPDGAALHIIHRDLSPANVLISASGELKLTDFGLARALRDAASTRTQTVAGHVGYMAPEQARGESLDSRCDLFGVGVILWELLAGKRLFLRESEPATLLALVADPVPEIGALRSDLDPAWQPFLDRALARELDARFPSAQEMHAELERLSPSDRQADIAALKDLVGEAREIVEPGTPADADTVAA
jgi:hypothetical protein